ncbi:MAG: NAD(P)H-hydrate dehydratase [Nitrospiraceae bacterium]|nr:NAD(P)H-hydrate dehydratase [Nitrospiraceae bacterium]
MKVASAEQMRMIDARTIEEYGIPGLVLMERAGLSVLGRIKELFRPQKTIVIAGGGNNGGDGLVVARLLKNSGWNVKVHFLSTARKASPECRAQLEAAKKFGVPVIFTPPGEKDFHAALIIDAIFGTGLGREVAGRYADVIREINRFGEDIISVDIPSGISSDTGRVMGTAVRADFTVTFGLPKLGHVLYPGAEHTGRLFIEDIGFPRGLLDDRSIPCELIEKGQMALIVPERPLNSFKNTFGHVLALAGSKGKTGAALLCARAALKSGAGLVTMGIPEEVADVFQSRVLDEMTLPLASRDGSISIGAMERIFSFIRERGDVLAMGPGLGVTPDIRRLVPEIVRTCPVPMVLDADALNALGGDPGVLAEVKAPVIITPHPGEMGRLTGRKGQEIEEDRLGAAASLSEKTGACVILKGARTVIAESGGRIFINPTGTPGMAKAGVGDVLTGMIAGFLAQGLNPLDAALLSVFTHGLAGEIAACKRGLHSMLASDIHDTIKDALEAIKNNQAMKDEPEFPHIP